MPMRCLTSMSTSTYMQFWEVFSGWWRKLGIRHVLLCFAFARRNPPTVGTLIRTNAAVRDFKRTGGFELVFRPIDYMSAGICVVSDAALGNVELNGPSVGTATMLLLPVVRGVNA